MIGQTFSHYRIVKELGKGGMGVVYLAQHTGLDRQVAIKISADANGPRGQQLRQRFQREIRLIAKLSHRNIATVHDGGTTPDGQLYLVMEFVRGKMLSDLIEERSLTLERTVEIIGDVAAALAEAHRHGIVHRDIKPSNVAINDQGEVKVLDFGLAKYLDEAAGTSQLYDASVNENGSPDAPPHGDHSRQVDDLLATRTRAGIILCTPEYASPEQAMGLPVDARTDLFSLGSVLYECLTGTRPFSASNPDYARAKVIRDDPPPPSTLNSLIPAELDRIALKALAKNPGARYQSAGELLVDLAATKASLQENERASHLQISSQMATSTESLPTPQTRGRSSITTTVTKTRIPVLYVIGAVIISLVSWGAWRLLRTKPHQPSPAAQRWYDEGTKALHDGTYYKASKMFEEAVKQDDKFALAHARLAEASVELGYFDKANAEIALANMLVDRSTLPRIDELYLQAINANVSRDFKPAVASYSEMSQQAQDSDRPHIYVDLGRAYEKHEELNKAIESYKEAIRLNSQYAPAFLREGILYARQQDFPNAEVAFDKAFQLYEIQTNPEGLAEVLYQRGVLFNSIGDIPKAREELERALPVVRTFSSASQQVKTMLQLSSVYRAMGDTELAKRYTTEAIDLARRNDLSDLITQGLLELGNVFFFRSEISEAEKSFMQALELARNDKARISEARALFSLGSLYIQQDNPDNGIPYLQQALPFFQQNGYRKEVMQSQTLLGQAYDLKGNYDSALKAFGEQLQLATQLNSQIQIALSHKGLGTVLAHQEKYTEALDHIEQSYSIYSAVGNKLYAGYNLISRADVLWRLGRYEDARASLNQASSLAEQPDGKFKQLWGRLYVVTAPMALSEQLYSQAIAESRKAIARDTSETKHPAIEAQYALGLAQSLSGLKRQGRETCERAVEMARRGDDPRLLAGAQLALAEAMLVSGDPTQALVTAKSAQQIYESSGQLESEWRAWLMAGRASQLLGDNKTARESFLRADSQISSLRLRWGDEYFKTYLNRPDIHLYHMQLRQAAATAQ